MAMSASRDQDQAVQLCPTEQSALEVVAAQQSPLRDSTTCSMTITAAIAHAGQSGGNHQVIARCSADIDPPSPTPTKRWPIQPRIRRVPNRWTRWSHGSRQLVDDVDVFVIGDGLAQPRPAGEARRLVSNLTEFTDKLNRTPPRLFGDRRKDTNPNERAMMRGVFFWRQPRAWRWAARGNVRPVWKPEPFIPCVRFSSLAAAPRCNGR
jgi:hypothetical protein